MRSCSRATSAGEPCRSRRATATTGIRARPTSRCRRTSMASASRRRRSSDIVGARVLAVLGDSVTTDHISPAGSIASWSPAGEWLQERNVEPLEFNSLRRPPRPPRGDDARHVRQHPAAQRPRAGQGRAVHDPPARRRAEVHLRRGDALQAAEDAAAHPRRQGVRLRLIARLGGQGHRAARRAGRPRRVVRADPPIQPGRAWASCRSSSCPATGPRPWG